MQNKSSSQAFTLIEVITAVFIITVGILGAFGLIQNIIAESGFSSSKLSAAYLAQEGIEIARNIRDSNWLLQRDDVNFPWDSGLSSCLSGCEADYREPQNYNNPVLASYSGRYLNLVNGFYSYAAGGNPTVFKRKITVSYPSICGGAPGCVMEITVNIDWNYKGVSHQFTVKDHLYKWH